VAQQLGIGFSIKVVTGSTSGRWASKSPRSTQPSIHLV